MEGVSVLLAIGLHRCVPVDFQGPYACSYTNNMQPCQCIVAYVQKLQCLDTASLILSYDSHKRRTNIRKSLHCTATIYVQNFLAIYPTMMVVAKLFVFKQATLILSYKSPTDLYLGLSSKVPSTLDLWQGLTMTYSSHMIFMGKSEILLRVFEWQSGQQLCNTKLDSNQLQQIYIVQRFQFKLVA